ncbi:ribonuclease P protein subunit p29 [Hetaerina americana]|uniref:ribonuclease P protein subunit p29 n=1 Tax=Hetaerina americana TaxID=62018 RepID=UPI003A7F440E
MDPSVLYSKLPSEVVQKLQLNPETNPSVLQSFLESCLPNSDRKDIDKELRRNILLCKLRNADSPRRPHRNKKKELSLKEKRKLGLFTVKKQAFKFNDFIPLHNLWKDYMCKCLSVEHLKKTGWTASPEDKRWQQFTLSLLKADYHGAYVQVVRSKCSSLVGLGGIIIFETKNTFKIIGEDNLVRVVPKQSSLFRFQLKGYEYVILGQHFCYRPSERSVKKIKNRVLSEL